MNVATLNYCVNINRRIIYYFSYKILISIKWFWNGTEQKLAINAVNALNRYKNI